MGKMGAMDKMLDYGMDGDRRTQLELFVDIWVKAVGQGEKMPQDGGHLVPEEEWNWVKSEVRKRLEIGSGKEVS
jgi:hypothetical protein